MTREFGKISPEDTEGMKMDMEATAFCNGFTQGFLSSFQGFNGEIFKEAQRPVMDSENFRKNMAEAFFAYRIMASEMEAMLAIEKGKRLN